MTPVTDPAILAQLNGDAGKPVTDPTVLTQLNGQQPSILDRIIASPVGRFAHDAILQPITGAAALLDKIDPTGGFVGPANQRSEQSYQDALARNRNTPGYAAARTDADKMAQNRGVGLTDQFIPSLAPSMAGVAGLFGGMDTSNAAADAQTAAQDAFHSQNPVSSTIANLVGGLLATPSGGTSLPQQISGMAGSPMDAATSYVQRLMASSPTASTPTALAAASTTKPITAAEAIGKPAEVALGALARRDGSTADALAGQMATRSASAPRRILDDYATASGIHPDAARGDIDAFVTANQKAAAPLYDGAYKANTNIASPMLDRILDTPAGKQALSDARVKMQNDMSLMGTPDAELMDQAKDGGTDLPAKGAASGMKLRVYDYVKRSLDDQISAAYRAGNTNEGSIIKDLKGKLVNELDKADVTASAGPNSTVPAGGLYAQARAKAGEYLSATKQYEAGQQHILDDKFPAQDMSTYVSNLGPADKQAYMGGVANRLFALQQAGKLKAAVFKAPMVETKLSTLMGPQKAKDFIQNMQTEQKMADFARTRVPGAGSPTAEYGAAMKDQDGVSALALDGAQIGRDLATGGVHKALGNYILNKGQDMAAGYLTRGMAIPVRDAAGELLMLPPADLAKRLQSLPPLQPTQAIQLPGLTNRSAIPLGLFGSSALLSQPSVPSR